MDLLHRRRVVALGLLAVLALAAHSTVAEPGPARRSTITEAKVPTVPLGERPALRAESDDAVTPGALAGPGRQTAGAPTGRVALERGPVTGAADLSGVRLRGLPAGALIRGRSPPGRA